MTEKLVNKLNRRDALSDEEKEILHALPTSRREARAGEDLVGEGDWPTESILMLEGISGRYKLLASGGRQITSLHVPGDFVDLHAFLLKKMDHAVVAVTDCTVGVVPHAKLLAITEQHPHLARMLWLSTLIDGAIHREWLAAMGRRSAHGQMAHLICEMYLKLEEAGRASEHRFELRLTQTQLADALGMSLVHVNRVLQKLRGDGLIIWEGSQVTIPDWDGLVEVADFDDTYLNRINVPR